VNAFVLDSPAGARLRSDWPAPQERPGWARVHTRTAGICNTDLELLRGYMNFCGVLGHEFVGTALDGPLAGERVVGGINFACGTCETCLAGHPRHCPTRCVLGILNADGVFAEQFLIPQANLLRVPDQVGDRAAVFTEPLAAACEVLEQLGNFARQSTLVLGDGKLGLLLAQTLRSDGFDVTLVGRHVERLGWLEGRGVNLETSVRGGRKFPLTVDATGSASGLETAIRATAPRGTLVLKTTIAARHEIDLSPIVIDEIHVIGSRCGPFEPALARLASGAIVTEAMIDSVYDLANIESAVERAACPGAMKVLVENR
jgi:threonine dehydrogenase-like Zn-dependent dehydrogenase